MTLPPEPGPLNFVGEGWTPEQVAEFKAEWEREAAAGFPGWKREMRPGRTAESVVRLKVVPGIDEEALLEAVLRVISGHAVIKPGETLVIRSGDWTPMQAEQYQEHLDARHDAGEIPFRVLVVIGQELGVVQAEPDDALAGLPGLPTHAVVEIAWDEDSETRTAKFGPWLTGGDDTYAQVIASFAGGWCAGKGIDGAAVTLSIGDESIAEGATRPYRDQPASPPRPPAG